MGKPAWTSILKSAISIRLFAILFLSILALFFIYTSICNHYRDTMTLELVRSEAFRASSFIKKSLEVEMMEKERDHIHRGSPAWPMRSERVYRSTPTRAARVTAMAILPACFQVESRDRSTPAEIGAGSSESSIRF
jgi:hypothetical protein